MLQATTLTVAVSPIPLREPEEVNLIVPPTILQVTMAMMMLVMRTIIMLNYEDESVFLGSFFDVLMLVMRTIIMLNYKEG